jgi:chromosome segregation ATPase
MAEKELSISELKEKVDFLINENMKLSKLNATLNFKLYAALKEIEKLNFEIGGLKGEILFLKQAIENAKNKLSKHGEEIF